MRSAFNGWRHQPVLKDARFEITPDESERPGVLDLASHPCHEHVVIHTVEKLFQVDVDDPAISRMITLEVLEVPSRVFEESSRL